MCLKIIELVLSSIVGSCITPIFSFFRYLVIQARDKDALETATATVTVLGMILFHYFDNIFGKKIILLKKIILFSTQCRKTKDINL